MVFAKCGFLREMPLDFPEFVTNRLVSDFVTLSDFYRSWISESYAIRLFHNQGNFLNCDIKYMAPRGV